LGFQAGRRRSGRRSGVAERLHESRGEECTMHAEASSESGGPFVHQPVLVDEVVRLFAGCRRVLDGTVGAGGHARALVEAGARVLGLDKDAAAVAAARDRLTGSAVAEVRQLDFAEAAGEPAVRAFAPDGVLLDLGVSSPQLDDVTRGFTFRPGAPLDMRMRADRGPTAAEWLNTSPVGVLAVAFRDYADEPPGRAARLAREIVRRRTRRGFARSDDLVNAIRAVLGPRSGPADFARLFQGVRVAVNDELARLERALPAYLDLLAPGGVFAVIAYHSGEDRLVKHRFREWARTCVCPPDQPVCTCRARPLGELLTRRPIAAGEEEIAANPRARSAHLRAFRKAR
jgi:16S rRNA (cytosine1402-N4)-methyltransferase